MKKILLILLIFILNIVFFEEIKASDYFDFNGYIQLRGISDFDDYTSFSVRRLKFWIKPKKDFSKHWEYKIQTTFTSFQQEKFFLQDVKISYKTKLFSIDLGQFVPEYSLERFQHDYSLPSIERAKVINTLIPNGTLGVRDIGIQANFHTKSNLFITHIGLFNGYGIKEYRFNNKGYMITNKSELNLSLNTNELKIGYSLQYRYAENLKLKDIFSEDYLFTGDDFRYNFFALFKSRKFRIQAEYLNADFNGLKSYGYYILSSLDIKKSQIVFSFEYYKDLIDTTIDKPYYRIAYNYLINKDKIKLSLDYYFQIIENKFRNYYLSIQFQMFLKQ